MNEPEGIRVTKGSYGKARAALLTRLKDGHVLIAVPVPQLGDIPIMMMRLVNSLDDDAFSSLSWMMPISPVRPEHSRFTAIQFMSIAPDSITDETVEVLGYRPTPGSIVTFGEAEILGRHAAEMLVKDVFKEVDEDGNLVKPDN